MASKYGFQQAGEQSKFGLGTVGRSGGYIVSTMPSGWKDMGYEKAKSAISAQFGSNPQVWKQFRATAEKYYKNKATSAPTAPAGTAGAAGSSMSASAKSAYEKALAHYAPGGGYGAGVEAGLERGRVKSTASGMQNLVSAGLAGTTMAAGLGKKYEEEVAAPTRAKVESARAEAIAGIQMSMGSAEQRGYESAQDRALSLQMQQTDIDAQQSGYNTQLMNSSMRNSSNERMATQQSELELALAQLRKKTQGGTSGPTTHKAGTFSFDDTQQAGSAYAASLRTRGGGGTAALPMYTATGTGAYMGGGKYLSPRQTSSSYGQ